MGYSNATVAPAGRPRRDTAKSDSAGDGEEACPWVPSMNQVKATNEINAWRDPPLATTHTATMPSRHGCSGALLPVWFGRRGDNDRGGARELSPCACFAVLSLLPSSLHTVLHR